MMRQHGSVVQCVACNCVGSMSSELRLYMSYRHCSGKHRTQHHVQCVDQRVYRKQACQLAVSSC